MTSAVTHVGPTTIPCPQSCEVPEGATLSEVPRPRHAWTDILVCPHEGCGRCLLVLEAPPKP